MSITYPLTLPTTKGVAAINLRAVNAVAISQSPFTFKQQVIAHQGQRWEADITLPPMKRADAEVWVSFLVSLAGRRGTFTMGDPNCAAARGSASVTPGTPVVNGGGQTGSSLTVSGLPASATGYLLVGDYIQLGGGSSASLHKVMQQVDSSASGTASIEIWPYIRTAPSDSASVVVGDAVGVFRLSSNETNWSIDTASFYGISFAATEAVS
tara:strand:- start:575 stop:1207 length:633 start_codon:yes stop_codon:yes gene_type:complete